VIEPLALGAKGFDFALESIQSGTDGGKLLLDLELRVSVVDGGNVAGDGGVYFFGPVENSYSELWLSGLDFFFRNVGESSAKHEVGLQQTQTVLRRDIFDLFLVGGAHNFSLSIHTN
jgi:hypothetical protein